ncbi:MAG: carbohydrate kinase [Candidatus Nanopelagicaceae bacterium]|nr:carbohydrate kinase [Candidatus Nanopelagicaceae bacterium]
MAKVYVAGEALIDLVNVGGSSTAHVGGGPANTAKALARLGLSSYFVGGISSDEYGALIEAELLESGVDLSLALRGSKPTALANALIDEGGVASYSFDLERTTTFDFSSSWLPNGADFVHVGSVATLIQPGATELFNWVSGLGVPVVFDPNVRPSIQSDRELYRAAVEKWVSVSTVVKLSEDDLDWLYGDESVVKDWLASGVAVVVVTRADKGLTGYFGDSVIEVPAVPIDLVDSIGAGDTIGAVIVEGLVKHGVSGLMSNLDLVLARAAKAASITCSRAGANPPWASELD